jgi:hypothetical protein
MTDKLVPITRLGKFFGGEDYPLDISMGRESARRRYEFHCDTLPD